MRDTLLLLGFIAIVITACNVGMGERLERGYAQQLKQNR